ncbi:RNA polymerase sigma factor [Planctomyces sp. SH-PL62]|uniref:RNA polymerase sigma factor n=1 Tax=Planctomyces sp. SH-PL62 TaxID=1636152 RepID=UPI00078C8E2F|nr:sigma-70 family RNA polymerase sigma factor [Planctomyces sp. SH-PL62]AMV40724.1 ECF RNA polymerase sigma-E factor [Planctomyces sp. SH-PL62]
MPNRIEDVVPPSPDGPDFGPGSTNSTTGGANSGRSETPVEERDASTTMKPLQTFAPVATPQVDDEGNLNDAWLVERTRRGDHAAFGVLVRRYERKLIRVLARLVRDPEIARDLAQETFWRVFNRLDRFDTGRRFGPWLFRVGVNLGLDHLRRGRGEPPPTSIDRARGDDGAPFELPDPDPRIRAEVAQEVQFILAQLPVSYRTILVLRDLEGFSSSEVAAIVGRREATIRWRLSKAREKFRLIWERRQDEAQEAATDG